MHKQFFIFSLAVAAVLSYFVPFLLLFGVGIYDMLQTKHSLRRNFPLMARIRWILEARL